MKPTALRAAAYPQRWAAINEGTHEPLNPIDLLFGGMEKLGPRGNVHTRHVLHLLPKQSFQVIVDAGCGTGRQTLVLAQALGTVVHAVDAYEPFLHDLTRRAKAALQHELSILSRRIA
jgi:methylase of polypeptide subunit release factors